VGHDLTLEAGRWSGRVVVGAEPTDVKITGSVDVGALTVIEGTGGVKALTDKDRQEIEAELRKQLAVDKHPEATFVAFSAQASGDRTVVNGTFTVRGASAPLSLNVEHTGPGGYRVTGVVAQSAHGIKPFSAFLGALKLRDEVEVEIEVTLP
jgi:polyisoprenoid-binding protein YceI